MEEYVQTEEEIRQEEPLEEVPTEAPEAPAVPEERTDKGKGKVREEEIEDFVSEEAYSNWKKHYANKGFVTERRFRNPITPFKEMIEQRGWEALCAHQKSGYCGPALFTTCIPTRWARLTFCCYCYCCWKTI